MTTTPRAVLVVGAGDATGGAIARRFAREAHRQSALVAHAPSEIEGQEYIDAISEWPAE